MPKARRPMPKWKPAPEGLIRRYERAIQLLAGVQPREMFGHPAVFANGQMFSGLVQDQMFIRLSDQDRSEPLKQAGARSFEPMPGRPMREYVVVPEAVLESEAQLGAWLHKGLAYARSLPPKASKPQGVPPRAP